MIKKTIQLAVVGFVLGMAIGNIIAIACSYASGGEVLAFSESLLEKTGSAAGALALQTLLSGVIGAVAFGGIMLYEIDRLPMLLVSVLHCAMILAVYFPVAIFLGWIRPTAHDIGMMACIMTAAYMAVWLFMYVRYRIEVREINELLQAENDMSAAVHEM